jgi:hypothetical protein
MINYSIIDSEKIMKIKTGVFQKIRAQDNSLGLCENEDGSQW